MHKMAERLREQAANDPFFESFLLEAANEMDRLSVENELLAMLVDSLIHEREAGT